MFDQSFNLSVAFQPWFIAARKNLQNVRWRINQAP
jgi:hypothetical protein